MEQWSRTGAGPISRLLLLGVMVSGCDPAHRSNPNHPGVFLEIRVPSVVEASFEAAQPSVASDPETGEVLMAWMAREEEGSWTLHFSRSTDGGATFGFPVTVGDLTGKKRSDGNLRLFPAGDRVELLWTEEPPSEGSGVGSGTLLRSTSRDGGWNWSPLEDVEALPAEARDRGNGARVQRPSGGTVEARIQEEEGGRALHVLGRTPSGTQAFQTRVPNSEHARSPELLLLADGRILAVWTEVQEGRSGIRTARLTLGDRP